MTSDELNQQSRLLNEFFVGVQQDQPVPEVDPTDLKRFHENMSERSREAGPGAAIALSALGLGQGSSGADAGPLCVRNWVIGIAFTLGLLADWHPAQTWRAPCIASLQLSLLTVFNSIQKRSLRA